MSDMKYDAITGQGIDIRERVTIPDGLIPGNANVEMDAKKAAGYYSGKPELDPEQLKSTKGQDLDD